VRRAGPRIRKQFRDDGFYLPTVIPERVAVIIEEPDTLGPKGIAGSIPGGVAGGGLGSIIGAITAPDDRTPEPKPEPPRAAAPKAVAEAPRIIRVSELKPSQLLHRVAPMYPALAKQARVSGAVKLEGIITTDGRLRSLTVVSGHPLLIPAAMDAVRQWVYQPTILNGAAVEVIAPITVNFVLN
jgi:protein TonB